MRHFLGYLRPSASISMNHDSSKSPEPNEYSSRYFVQFGVVDVEIFTFKNHHGVFESFNFINEIVSQSLRAIQLSYYLELFSNDRLMAHLNLLNLQGNVYGHLFERKT